ncbi:MAG TPA: DUF4397 domain-containing protein [Dinghuibacter sp.]|uniref:DUF4397 domain-containing protein n=1 Tax=Dinghuibacter sp. TaxID=2024697 RepID=UPI002CDE5A76|nr:DUF4397 domain-containing protein [Dinghuibacter sp.]HTJ11459.1 DUF4397 domain-containing protein [Dinghuibacter sp.]
MKRLLYAAITVLVILGSCKKNFKYDASYKPMDSTMAYLKIIDASPLFRQITTYQDTFIVFINGAKVTASSLTFGGAFPGTATNTYLAVPPGPQEIKLSVPGIVNVDSIKILTLNLNMQAGRRYTLMLTDSMLTASRDSSRIFVQDFYNAPVTGYVNFRFIHAVTNDTPGLLVDLFSYARNANILSKVKPDSVSPFQTLGVNLGVADTLYVRRSGTTRTLAKLLFAPPPPFNQETYTVYYAGNDTLKGKKAPALYYYTH